MSSNEKSVVRIGWNEKKNPMVRIISNEKKYGKNERKKICGNNEIKKPIVRMRYKNLW